MTPNAIKNLRKKLGLTQAEFAERLGVSHRAAQGWESRVTPHAPSPLAEAALKILRNPVSYDSKLLRAINTTVKSLGKTQ